MFCDVINRIYIKIFIIFISFFIFYGCKTVNNTDKNRDKDIPVDIYVGANYCYWKNGEWFMFPFDQPDLKLSSFLISGKDIYAGGNILTDHIGPGHDKACILKNGKIIPITYICNDNRLVRNSEIRSIAIYNNDIYAGGYAMTCSGLEKAGYWKNGKWIELKPINSKKNSSVSSITIYNGDVYAAGVCYIDSKIRSAGYWKNGEWTTLASPDDLVNNSGVAAMVIHNDDIYVAGYCDYSPKISIPGYWKNGKWIKLDDNGKFVTSFFIDDGDIYVGGFIGSGLTTSIAGYWKNGKWIELNTLHPGKSSLVSSIVVHNKNVYAAGWYDNNTNILIPCYWKNGELITLYYEAKRKPDVISIIVVDKE